MTDLHFADLRISDALPPLEVQITQDVIDRAALGHLDLNPVHTNLEWSERAQVFNTPKTVAHGMFTQGLMASLIQRHWGRAGAAIQKMETKFTKPVPEGQTLRCAGRIIELHPLGPTRNAVVVALTVHDDVDDVVAVGTFRVSIPD